MRGLYPIILTLLILALLFTGCRREESNGEEAAPAVMSGGAAEGDAVAPGGSTAGDASGPASEEEPIPGGAGGERRDGGESSEATVAIAPVELPLTLLNEFPEEPNWARDARIGTLQTTLLTGDPQALRATRSGEEFLEDLIAGATEGESFHDSITAAQFLETLRAECDGFRVGVAQRLPQTEWAVPFRCLLRGEPVPLSGTLYVNLEGSPVVVDGSLEQLPEVERVEPEAAREESTPF